MNKQKQKQKAVNKSYNVLLLVTNMMEKLLNWARRLAINLGPNQSIIASTGTKKQKY